MYHANILAAFPDNTHFKHVLLMYWLPEDDKQAYLDERDEIYRQHVEFDKLHPEIFSFATLKQVLMSLSESRYNCFHTFGCLIDFLVLVATFGLGVYTCWLGIQTIYFVRQENSMIDHMKFERWQSDPRRFKA